MVLGNDNDKIGIYTGSLKQLAPDELIQIMDTQNKPSISGSYYYNNY